MTDKTKKIIIRGIDMDEYIRTFKFGVRLIILISFLALPPVIGGLIGSLATTITEKIPLLYISELKITAVQNYNFKYKPTHQYELTLTTNEKIYFATNRAVSNDEETRASNEVLGIINNTNPYSVKHVKVIDKDTKTEKGIRYDFESYEGTAVYGHHTNAGNFVIVPVYIGLVIVCLALYFPLFKAIFNLFRRRKSKPKEQTV